VPMSGWYGLCFAGASEINETKSSLSTERPLLEGFEALFSKDSHVVSLELPFTHRKEKLVSVSVGKLIYLAEGTSVSVVAQTEQSKELSAAGTASAQWRLIFQRYVEKGCSQEPQIGTFSATKNPLICGICVRTFASLHAVKQHIQSEHRTILTDSIWSRPLKVIFEDMYMAVVVKPQGMAVQGDKRTLLRSDLLLKHTLDRETTVTWPDGASDLPLKKARPVHRLDAGTGGLLVVAKTRLAEAKLKKAFEDRTCHKRYQALVYGKMQQPSGVCEVPLSRKPSITHYRVMQHVRSLSSNDGCLTIVDLRPVTGRQHQIRRHLQGLGHPIYGDARYGPKLPKAAAEVVRSIDNVSNIDPQSRLCLWAMEITLPHPVTREESTFRMEEPEWLKRVIEYEEEQWERAQSANDA